MFSILAATVLLTGVPPFSDITPSSFEIFATADSTPILFARARDEARADRAASAIQAYLAGARAASSSADWMLYRRDISWIATPAELTAFDSAGSDTRVALLDAFWSSRDGRDHLGAGGRFAEHVRRLDIAMADFRVRPKRGKVPVSRVSEAGGGAYDYTVGQSSMLRDFVPTQGQIDDRGVILIRHGAPDARVASSGVESWIYQRDVADNLVVHFGENVFDGSSGNTTLIAAPPVRVLASLCGIDSASCTVGQRAGGASDVLRERLRQRALVAIRELTTTESAAIESD